MDIELLTVGKTTTSYINQGLEEYCRRLKHYIPFRITSIPDIKNTAKMSENNQKQAEGSAVLSKLTPSDHVILLDERGKEFTSKEFAVFIQRLLAGGKKRAVFIIGGPYGFSDEVYSRADSKISMSKMTFSHEMVRLFFTEQIYRAMTILRGEPYHHE